jgi:hypothetical protein
LILLLVLPLPLSDPFNLQIFKLLLALLAIERTKAKSTVGANARSFAFGSG